MITTNKIMNLVSLASAILILLLILVSSTASAATETCSIKGTNYQYWSGEQYPLIDLFGEKYVPVREYTNSIWQSHVDKLAKLVNDSKGNYSLTAGKSLEIGQGYSLHVKQVDVDGQKVWLEFDKDGQYVDDQIISANSGESTWTCTLNNIQGENNVPVLKVHVNQIFQDATGSIVKIDGLWLIDYANSRTLKVEDKFGDYTLKTVIDGTDASNFGSLIFDYGITITDLGTLGGSDSYANEINENGQIVGYSETGTGQSHACLWQNDVITDLGTLPRGNESGACGINNKGKIVGYSETGTVKWQLHACLWQNSTMTDLGTLGGSDSHAHRINENGQIVGESVIGTGKWHAFLWQNSTMIDLGTLPGYSHSSANGINDKGQIVGYSETGTDQSHAFLWQNGVMTDLGTLPGYSHSSANGINDKGQIVGYSGTGTGQSHACLWQNGVMTDLGTLPGDSDSIAYGINENGQIVGVSNTQTGEYHATLWTLPTSSTDPVANFSASPTTGNAPLNVSFTDKSANNPTAWKWNFGDGTNSTSKNPIHKYSTAGNYTVSLTASNSVGSNTTTKTNYIKVLVVIKPIANFTSNVTSGYAPLTVLFTDKSTNNPTAWKWNFGDGTNSTVKNPVHKYSTKGNYTVSLTSTNAAGSNTITKTNYIKVFAVVKPVTNFTSNVTSGYAPLTVAFTDKSINTPTSWKWTFGDGTNSTSKNPVHKYSAKGNYTVTLTASNSAGSNTTTKMNYIKVTTVVKPVANFTSNVTSGYAPLNVAFTDKSTNIPTSWKWTFGDGTNSTVRNPIHKYSTKGNYTVSLTATNTAGSNTTTKTNYIKVTTVIKPVANFTSNVTSGYAPLNVAFTDKSTNNPTSWKWTFGDGTNSTSKNPIHKYSTKGNYTVTLTASNSAGSNTTTKTNYIKVSSVTRPVANFTSNVTSGIAPLNVAFTDKSTNNPTSWKWTFGDGTNSTIKNPIHKYSTVGNYTVALTASNSAGSNTTTKTNYIKVRK